jgi:hypothetical protein
MNNKCKSTATGLGSFLDNPSGMPRPRFYDDMHERHSYHNAVDGFEGVQFSPTESVQKGENVDRDINNSDPWQSRLNDSIQHTSQGYYSPYGFNSYMNGTASTSNHNQYGYSYGFQPGHHSYIYEASHWHGAPSTSQWNPTTRNSRSSESLLVSPPSPLFEQSGSRVVDDHKALENLQDDDRALTSGTRSSGGGPIYTPESPTWVIDRTRPCLSPASGPPPASPMLRGASLPSGTIHDFQPLDGPSGTTSLPRGNGNSIRYEGVSHLSVSDSYNRSNNAIATPNFRHVNDISGPIFDKWQTSTRQALARQQEQAQGVGETIYCPAGPPVPSPTPVEARDRSSSGTVMPDEEFPVHRQVLSAAVDATDEQPAPDESSNSMGRKHLSTVANGYGVQAGNMNSNLAGLAEHIRNTRNAAFGASGGDWEPLFQSRHESPAPASAQDDKEMSEASSMHESQSSSVMNEIITDQPANPLNAPSIASTVDVGSLIRDALRPAATATISHPAHPMLTQAQTPTPTPITATAKSTEDTLHALTFEPYTNALGKKSYDWSNDPGWPVAVESLPEIVAGNCLDRLMGDHALGEAIAQAMHDTIGGTDEEWVIRAVLGFGEGAMVLVRKV